MFSTLSDVVDVVVDSVITVKLLTNLSENVFFFLKVEKKYMVRTMFMLVV